MALNKCKLGIHIELLTETNSELQYGIDDVRGVNNLKNLMQTKADLNGRDLSKFQIVYPGEFVFNHRTSRNGSKFSIAFNDGNKPVICTEDYVVFRVKESSKDRLSSEWLYMFFNRSEFDRYAITNSWGSSTEFYNWSDVCDIDIELPDIEIQKKYVNTYLAMVANQQCYERGLDDLKLSIDASIERFKHSAPYKSLRLLLNEIDNRNTSGDRDVFGVTMAKSFIPSVANLEGVDLTKYKLVASSEMACNLMHVGRDKALPIAVNNDEKSIVVSPAYFVFSANEKMCLPEYLIMWFSREESGRFCWFISDTSVRGGFSLEQFYSIEIPVPDIEKQQAVVEIFNAYNVRRDINERLKAQIKDICPILIKGSIEEARKTKEA